MVHVYEHAVKILLGIFTLETAHDRRNLIRQSYWKVPNNVDRFFIVGRLTDNVTASVVAENNTYGDILVLNSFSENMNDGKSLDYFDFIHRQFYHKHYDFVLKGDDDAIYHLPNLERKLSSFSFFGQSVDSFYFGAMKYLSLGSDGVVALYALGSLYGISWNLLHCISAPRQALNRVGGEDMVVATWLHNCNVALKMIDIGESHRNYRSCGKSSLHSNMLVVHPLKLDHAMTHCSHLYFGDKNDSPTVQLIDAASWKHGKLYVGYVPFASNSCARVNMISQTIGQGAASDSSPRPVQHPGRFSVVRCAAAVFVVLSSNVNCSRHEVRDEQVFLHAVFEANNVLVEVVGNAADKIPVGNHFHPDLLLVSQSDKVLVNTVFRSVSVSANPNPTTKKAGGSGSSSGTKLLRFEKKSSLVWLLFQPQLPGVSGPGQVLVWLLFQPQLPGVSGPGFLG